MEIWEVDKLVLFLVFFIPGFVSLKVYDLFIPVEQRDFSKSVFEVVAYSALNFAALSWLIIWLISKDFSEGYRWWYYLVVVLVMLVFPTLWALIFVRFRKWKFLTKFILHPFKKPWDYVFGKRESYWVIVHLKDGRMIGGMFGEQSFASSFPAEEQIYLEEVWVLDKNGKFKKPIERSAGIIVLSSEILAIEFQTS
jgi:hypothetical protein